MKKELPKVFQNKIDKTLNNNKSVFISTNNDVNDNTYDVKEKINEEFKQNKLYNTDVIIEQKDKTISTTVIGRTKNNIVTNSNQVIPIESILNIKIIN